MALLSNMAHRASAPDRAQLHTAYSSSTSTLLSVATFGQMLVCLGAATQGFRHWEIAPLFAGIAAAGLVAWMFSGRLRYVPSLYGTRAGLDIEWPTGDKRHVEWHEIVEIRVHRVSGIHSKLFRVYLVDEALEFWARSDFPEIVERFQAAA